jgi:hypothetical protein
MGRVFPPDSPLLKAERLKEPEVYNMGAGGRINSIVNIHNPSVEFPAPSSRRRPP